MYYCYVLANPQDEQVYISHTYDLKREVNFHNQGKFDATKKHSNWNVLWYGAFGTETLSKEFEAFLKTEVGSKFINKWFVGEKVISKEVRPNNAVMCPICGGKGEAPNRIFHKYGKSFSGNKVICSNCMGKGWIDPYKKAESLE